MSPILRKGGTSRFRRLSEHQTAGSEKTHPQIQLRNTPSYIIIKILTMQSKERILKAAKEKPQANSSE
jgi:hypothetical protein